MFCNNCGSQIDDKAVVCPHCGAATQNLNVTTQNKSNGFAIAGFVLSFFFALLGLIFSIIGLNKAKTIGSGKGLAIAGLVISLVWIVLVIILLF